MSRLDELQAEIVIGDDARRFLESELGRIIVGIAEQERLFAQAALVDVDAEDHKAIRTLQNKAKYYAEFSQWLSELLSRGEAALGILENEAKDE